MKKFNAVLIIAAFAASFTLASVIEATTEANYYAYAGGTLTMTSVLEDKTPAQILALPNSLPSGVDSWDDFDNIGTLFLFPPTVPPYGCHEDAPANFLGDVFEPITFTGSGKGYDEQPVTIIIDGSLDVLVVPYVTYVDPATSETKRAFYNVDALPGYLNGVVMAIIDHDNDGSNDGYQLNLGDVAIINPPTFVSDPASQSVNEGNPFTFTAEATGYEPIFYQWFKDGIAIPGATSPVYGSVSATSGDAGNYVCVATNAAGSTPSTTASLTVWPPTPKMAQTTIIANVDTGKFSIETDPGNKAYAYLGLANTAWADRIGNELYFATGGPPWDSRKMVDLYSGGHIVEWNFSEIPCSPVEISAVAERDYVSGPPGGPMTTTTNEYFGDITNQNTWEKATYKIIDNGVVTETQMWPTGSTWDVNLPAPYFTQEPTDVKAEIGQNAEFISQGRGIGPLSYQWYQKEGPAQAVPIAGATSSRYIVYNVDIADNGLEVFCQLSNKYGFDVSGVATLTVDDGSPVASQVDFHFESATNPPALVALITPGNQSEDFFNIADNADIEEIGSVVFFPENGPPWRTTGTVTMTWPSAMITFDASKFKTNVVEVNNIAKAFGEDDSEWANTSKWTARFAIDAGQPQPILPEANGNWRLTLPLEVEKPTPSLDSVEDIGNGDLEIGWSNKADIFQYLAFAYDLYTRSWREINNGSMWQPFPKTANTGVVNIGLTGGYHLWISNHYDDGSYAPCKNPWTGIVYSGTPHTPINLATMDVGAQHLRFTWKPDVFGVWSYEIGVYKVDSGWVETTLNTNTALWHFVNYPDFVGVGYGNDKSIYLEVPGPGEYWVWIRGVGWEAPFKTGEYAQAFEVIQ